MRSSISLKIFGLVLVNVFALSIAQGEVRTLDWMLQETSYTRLCSTKKILTVNGMFPGPALSLHKGERIKVNVHNQGTYGVTIHWGFNGVADKIAKLGHSLPTSHFQNHPELQVLIRKDALGRPPHGVKQPRNPWSDGPEYVAQCPIKPGANFTYEIILSDEEGTLWWHAHSDWSRATLHGPIFVYPKSGTQYPYPRIPDAEFPIVLASWYKGDVMQIIEDALASGGEVNKSDAFTINGQPGDTQPCSTKDMFRMTVEYGKTYLLRIINSVMNEEMFFMVANHKLVVVGIDASYVKPISTNYIMITPGQTMDVLLVANQNISHYYMAARAFGELVYSNATTTAMVQYSGAPNTTNGSFPTLPNYNASDAAMAFTRRFRALNDDAHPVTVPKTVDRRILMTLSVGTLPCWEGKNCSGPNDNRVSASLNNISFDNPKTDVLQAYWKQLNGVYKTDFPDNPPFVFNFTMTPMIGDNFTMSDLNGTRVIVVDYNMTMEFVFQVTNVMNASENHPMHLHGYSFYVVGSGNGIFDENIHPNGYNLKDPPEINTIGVPMSGWTAIRFTANNPGVWFMHCHLERHASWGMDTVLIVKNGPTQATSIRPPSYINPC